MTLESRPDYLIILVDFFAFLGEYWESNLKQATVDKIKDDKLDGSCIEQGEMGNVYKFLIENMKERNQMKTQVHMGG
jgi:hypothetical protein